MAGIIARISMALVGTLSLAAAAQTGEVNRRIEALLGPSAPYEQAVTALQAAVSRQDAQTVAAMVAYPIRVVVAGKSVTLHNAADLVRQYQQIVTPDVAAAIVSQKYEDLFVNARGVMIGDGQVWIAGICTRPDCSQAVVKVIAIQSTSGQEPRR